MWIGTKQHHLTTANYITIKLCYKDEDLTHYALKISVNTIIGIMIKITLKDVILYLKINPG